MLHEQTVLLRPERKQRLCSSRSFSFECTLGISYAPGFAADFPPEMSEFYQRTHRVRLKNSGTSDKKSACKFRYNEIPRAHLIL